MIAQRTNGLVQCLVGLLFLISLSFMTAERCHGYIMPAEQLIAFMAKNFSKFQTLVIVQSTQQKDQRYEVGEESFIEKIWMKSPDVLHSQVLDHPMGRLMEPDITYRQLLIANSAQRLLGLLSRMGVNFYSVSFTRIDGNIAYRIGDEEPESPKILIEKDRFLPLLVVYRPSENSLQETITVQFKDYRKMDQGWYPFEITYYDGKELREDYTINTLHVNVPIDPTLFVVPGPESAPDRPSEQGQIPPEEERLKEIIKKFEEKYQ